MTRATLQRTLSSDWDAIDGAREAVVGFLAAHSIEPDASTSLGMVASELLENAMKYGKPVSDDAIKISVESDPRVVTIEVKHPLGDSADLERLDRMIQWIRGHQDPFQAYLHRIEEISRQATDSSESGLGLVRIAYEGQCVLDFYVDEHDMLSISAVYRR